MPVLRDAAMFRWLSPMDSRSPFSRGQASRESPMQLITAQGAMKVRSLPMPHPWIPAQGRNDELRAVLVGHFHADDGESAGMTDGSPAVYDLWRCYSELVLVVIWY